jgi:hypothetical protein
MKLKERQRSSGILVKLFIAVILIGLLASLVLFSKSSSSAVTSITKDIAADFTPDKLELQIPEANFRQIKKKRKEALERGLLFSSAEDMVDGTLRANNETKPIRLRLKGDLLDHIQGEKWSYRIQLKNDQQWNQMQTFSIHNSGARSHLAEWLMLQLFRQEGIITPNYDFIQLEENGVDKGVYAYEQFFDNNLLIQNKRPIGPILKHADDAYWENVQKGITPFYWTHMAEIELMNTENKNNPSFIKSFQQAKSKLQAYLDGQAKLSDVFDVEKLAKYYALMEISHAYHAQQMTNIRFYFNPLTAKLEPIGFDCFGTTLPNVTKDWSAAGEGQIQFNKPPNDYPNGGVYMYKLFLDNEMTASYLKHLQHYTSDHFLNKIKHDWNAALDQRLAFIQSDEAYADYSFAVDDLFKKAKWTREKILPLPEYSLNVQVQEGSRKQLVCSSYHYFPMEVIGLGNEEVLQTLETPVFLDAYHPDHNPDSEVIQNPNNYRRVYFKTIGIDSIFSEEINRLSLVPIKPKIQQGDLSFVDEHECININGSAIKFGPCPISLEQTVIIPKGYLISVEPGTVIELMSNANFISFSPIMATGTETENIQISGTKNNGLMLSQIKGKSQFNHTILTGLGQINEAEYQTSAAITIYDSEVEFTKSKVFNCESNNALTFQNADFNINDLSIEDSPGNGITLEYSYGEIDQLAIADVNKDGLLLNNSSLQLKNATFDFIKGTAFHSNGSGSTDLTSIEIKDCYRAFKLSNSSVSVDGVNIQDVEEGVFASQQNESAEIVFTNGNMSDVQFPYLIGSDDFLYWNGRKKKAQ